MINERACKPAGGQKALQSDDESNSRRGLECCAPRLSFNDDDDHRHQAPIVTIARVSPPKHRLILKEKGLGAQIERAQSAQQ